MGNIETKIRKQFKNISPVARIYRRLSRCMCSQGVLGSWTWVPTRVLSRSNFAQTQVRAKEDFELKVILIIKIELSFRVNVPGCQKEGLCG